MQSSKTFSKKYSCLTAVTLLILNRWKRPFKSTWEAHWLRHKWMIWSNCFSKRIWQMYVNHSRPKSVWVVIYDRPSSLRRLFKYFHLVYVWCAGWDTNEGGGASVHPPGRQGRHLHCLLRPIRTEGTSGRRCPLRRNLPRRLCISRRWKHRQKHLLSSS